MGLFLAVNLQVPLEHVLHFERRRTLVTLEQPGITVFEGNVGFQSVLGMERCSANLTHEFTLGLEMEIHVSPEVVGFVGREAAELALKWNRLFTMALLVSLQGLLPETGKTRLPFKHLLLNISHKRKQSKHLK